MLLARALLTHRNMDEHVDERIRRWVTAEDDSEHTTVADPLVGTWC